MRLEAGDGARDIADVQLFNLHDDGIAHDHRRSFGQWRKATIQSVIHNTHLVAMLLAFIAEVADL